MEEKLKFLLANPSPESWAAIIEIGKTARRDAVFSSSSPKEDQAFLNSVFCQTITPAALKHWPPEIERLCPSSWPRVYDETVEHRVLETDTYQHYIASICGHPDLKLSDRSQAVWLERRFTGGIVSVSTVQIALCSIAASLKASSVKGAEQHVQSARNVLSNGVRQVGKVGCADLTGGVTVEEKRDNYDGTHRIIRHEYRLEVEVKVGKQPQDAAQVARMNSVRSRGGCYVLARSVQEAVDQVKEFIKSRS